MKRLMILTGWVLCAAGLLRADELPWESDYDKALETAKTKQKPVLIDFSASWCGPCRMMETTTFAGAGVQDDLAAYVLIKVDLDQNPALASKYRVQAIPACFILNQFGERVSEHVGYLDQRGFRSWLANNEDAALATLSKSQAVADHMKSLVGDLESTAAPAMRDRAIHQLIDMYCAKDAGDDGTGAKLVEQELRGFVQRHPAIALPYLNDHRLAVRILFGTLFADKMGTDSPFDPWAKSDVRAATLAVLAQRIGPLP